MSLTFYFTRRLAVRFLPVFLPITLAAGAVAGELPPRNFSHPDRIRYDSQCLTIGGKDVFIYSGAFHYFRCPKELWRDRFQKIKEAGLNTVETYVPWNWHEQQMPGGLSDFSKVNLVDLEDWLKMAEEFGFYVIIRPGPYICAEWDTGGFPRWLLAKKPEKPLRERAWLRSDDPVYLAWCKHWYAAVCPVIARHQITQKAPGGPGVILVQLENEYDYAGLPAAEMLKQLETLAVAARAGGIDVPFFTCWTHPVRGCPDTWMRQVFDTCNFYPRWNVDEIKSDIEKTRHEQPDAPLATTELQGGWFSQIGGQLSGDQDGLTAAQINNLTLFAIQNGETILNYYMLCGGLNPSGWEARGTTTTYDYNAPIREWGAVGERYRRVQAIGRMLGEHGARLARSAPLRCQVDVSDADVKIAGRQAPDGSRYFFVRTSQHTAPRAGTARVSEGGAAPELVFNYKLEPFGAAVLHLPPGVNDATRGKWLPEQAPAVDRPSIPQSGVTLTSALKADDGDPSHWQPFGPGVNLAQSGLDDTGFLLYRAHIASAIATNLLVEFPEGDAVSVSINGRCVQSRGSVPGISVFPLPPGASDVRLLYENHGHANSGIAMERVSGIIAARLTRGLRSNAIPIVGWRMRRVASITRRREVEANFRDDDWTPVGVENVDADNLPARQKAVFRAGINLTAAEFEGRRKILTIGRIDDVGWVYVNGKGVGETTDWARSYSFDVTGQLHPGHNSVAVIVQNDKGAGGLGAPSLADEPASTPVPLEGFAPPAGVEGQYWQPSFNDRNWKSVNLPECADNTGSKSLLTWYRMKFELQPGASGPSTPWRLRINADGNGALYLNGHPLGRYWQAGPQHDFFLPECWLNFGAGRSNVLALNLRSVQHSTALLSAVVQPCP